MIVVLGSSGYIEEKFASWPQPKDLAFLGSSSGSISENDAERSEKFLRRSKPGFREISARLTGQII